MELRIGKLKKLKQMSVMTFRNGEWLQYILINRILLEVNSYSPQVVMCFKYGHISNSCKGTKKRQTCDSETTKLGKMQMNNELCKIICLSQSILKKLNRLKLCSEYLYKNLFIKQIRLTP